MPSVPLKKIKLIIQSACHSVYHLSKYFMYLHPCKLSIQYIKSLKFIFSIEKLLSNFIFSFLTCTLRTQVNMIHK